MSEQRTERQKIQNLLEHSIDGLTPEQVSEKLSDKDNLVPTSRVIDHINHIKKSLRNDEKQILAMPPKCMECGYENFDKILNVPSKCPSDNCHSKRIAEPKFMID